MGCSALGHFGPHQSTCTSNCRRHIVPERSSFPSVEVKLDLSHQLQGLPIISPRKVFNFKLQNVDVGVAFKNCAAGSERPPLGIQHMVWHLLWKVLIIVFMLQPKLLNSIKYNNLREKIPMLTISTFFPLAFLSAAELVACGGKNKRVVVISLFRLSGGCSKSRVGKYHSHLLLQLGCHRPLYSLPCSSLVGFLIRGNLFWCEHSV